MDEKKTFCGIHFIHTEVHLCEVSNMIWYKDFDINVLKKHLIFPLIYTCIWYTWLWLYHDCDNLSVSFLSNHIKLKLNLNVA